MALKFFDGGGLYYATMTDKWDYYGLANQTMAVDTGTNGRWAGRCIRYANNDPNYGAAVNNYIGISLAGSLSEYVVQFAYNITVGPTGNYVQLCEFYEGTTSHVELCFEATNNAFTVRRNGTVIATSANNQWNTASGWRYVRVRVKIHDSTGTFTMDQDGVSVFAVTGADTQNGGTGIIDRIYFGQTAAVNNSNCRVFDVRLQDIAICSVTGNVPNDLHTGGRVRLLSPSANGDTNNGTPSAGSAYQCVDEIPNNGNTDYVGIAASGDLELYALDNLPLAPSVVYGVASNNIVNKDDAGAANVAAIIKTNSTVYVGSDVSIPSSTYIKAGAVWDLNPNTSVAFTGTEINALQGGLKRTSQMPHRLTQHQEEVYVSGGETVRETQHQTEAYVSGGETVRLTQHALEVYYVEAPLILTKVTQLPLTAVAESSPSAEVTQVPLVLVKEGVDPLVVEASQLPLMYLGDNPDEAIVSQLPLILVVLVNRPQRSYGFIL